MCVWYPLGVDFHVSDAVKTAVDRARSTYQAATQSLGVDVFVHDAFGKKLCKEQKVSPDAVMQLGYQALYSIHFFK